MKKDLYLKEKLNFVKRYSLQIKAIIIQKLFILWDRIIFVLLLELKERSSALKGIYSSDILFCFFNDLQHKVVKYFTFASAFFILYLTSF